MTCTYIIDGHVPKPEPDARKWATWFESCLKMEPNPRIVAKTQVGEQEVSTVFLGVDHNFHGKGPPILFETMIFPECEYCVRSCTWEESETEHRIAVEKLQEQLQEQVHGNPARPS
jgi:hypothetical protein